MCPTSSSAKVKISKPWCVWHKHHCNGVQETEEGHNTERYSPANKEFCKSNIQQKSGDKSKIVSWTRDRASHASGLLWRNLRNVQSCHHVQDPERNESYIYYLYRECQHPYYQYGECQHPYYQYGECQHEGILSRKLYVLKHEVPIHHRGFRRYM